MCCFVVPMAEAIVTTIATLVLQQTGTLKPRFLALRNPSIKACACLPVCSGS